MSKNPKNQWYAVVEVENLYLFWTTWGISMKFSKFWKNGADDNIKYHRKPGFYVLSRKHNFGKTTDRVKVTPSLLRAKPTFVYFNRFHETLK